MKREPWADRIMEASTRYVGENFFELSSLLLAVAALILAALAFRVAKQAIEATKDSDRMALRVRAQEGLANARRSFLSLQAACRATREQWEVHHDRHRMTIGPQDFRRADTLHIAEVENEGRKLLHMLTQGVPEIGVMLPDAFEAYIERTDHTALEIERLSFRLSSPKPLRV